MVDATIVPVPKQRNTGEENEAVKAGQTPEDWEQKPAKNRQKDKDARWTKKHGKSFFGYKNHVNADARYKLIRGYDVTDASVHDSQKLDGLLNNANTSQDVYADSAYRSAETKAKLDSAASRAASIAAHPGTIHCRTHKSKPTGRRARCAPGSSTCSVRRRMRRAGGSFAPSARCGREPRSGCRTSSTMCVGS